jgi:WD40 repeat protein
VRHRIRKYSILIAACCAFACCQRKPEDRRIVCIAASRSGKWLAAGTAAGRIAVWNTVNPTQSLHAQDPGGVLNEIQFSPDEQWLAVAGRNLTLRPLAQFNSQRVLRGDDRNYGSAQFSPNADTLLTIDGKGVIETLNLKSGASAAKVCCSTIGGGVAYTPDGERFLCAGHLPRMWDARSAALLAQFTREREFMLFAPIAFLGDQLLMGSQDGGIHRYNWRTGERLAPSRRGGSWVDTIAVQPRVGVAVYAGTGKELRIWNTIANSYSSLDGVHPTSNIVFTTADGPLAIGLANGTVELWNIERAVRSAIFSFPTDNPSDQEP